MGIDRVGEIYAIQHGVAILQLADRTIGKFHCDTLGADLFDAGDRRVDHAAPVTLVAISPADPFALMNLYALLVAEFQAVELAGRFDFYRLHAMFFSAHVAEIYFALLEPPIDDIGRASCRDRGCHSV